jgi:hypothetical protein
MNNSPHPLEPNHTPTPKEKSATGIIQQRFFGRALRASCLLVLHLKNLGASELKRMLRAVSFRNNLAFTLVVQERTLSGRNPRL